MLLKALDNLKVIVQKKMFNGQSKTKAYARDPTQILHGNSNSTGMNPSERNGLSNLVLISD